MAVLPADVIGIAPEYSFTTQQTVVVAEIQNAINDAVLELSAEAWGAKLDLATKWLAAHKLARAHPELSLFQPRTWETPGASDAGEYGLTRYGIEFARLQKQLFRVVVSGGGTWPSC